MTSGAAAGRLVRNGFADIRGGPRTTESDGWVLLPDGPVSLEAIAATKGRLQRSPIGPERLAQRGYVNLERIFLDDRARPYTEP